jgi:alkanesulfonate monooxygenase SsuD/methylene tetrahydromethanopterin reductase-like flavin-dependent oxidoreductase (luciferase family)
VAVAGRLGDRVTITVGARRDLVAARLDTLRQARTTEGLDPASIEVGAYLVAAVDDDLTRARALVRGNVAIFAHFQRHATDLGRADQAVVAAVTERWQEASHGIAVSAQADALTDDSDPRRSPARLEGAR